MICYTFCSSSLDTNPHTRGAAALGSGAVALFSPDPSSFETPLRPLFNNCVYAMTAKNEPMVGPTQYTQCAFHLPAQIAGSSERAGFIEAPVRAELTELHATMTSPMSKGAIAFGPLSSTAVPKTTRTRMNVRTTSNISAWPDPMPGEGVVAAKDPCTYPTTWCISAWPLCYSQLYNFKFMYKE